MGNYTSKGAAKLTIGKNDDDDGEMNRQQQKFKKLLRVLSSIFIYIKSYYMDGGSGH